MHLSLRYSKKEAQCQWCKLYKTPATVVFLYEVRQTSLMMADIPGYVLSCLHTGKRALLAILVSGGIVLQILVSGALSF